jgi:hypothetical protein
LNKTKVKIDKHLTGSDIQDFESNSNINSRLVCKLESSMRMDNIWIKTIQHAYIYETETYSFTQSNDKWLTNHIYISYIYKWHANKIESYSEA